MERIYTTGTKNDVKYFYGTEVERTPAYGLYTLFVVGLHPVETILNKIKGNEAVKHIYLGANKSFHQNTEWATLLDKLLHEGYWVTLDYPNSAHNFVMRTMNQQMRHSKFIPMVSFELPNIEGYSYNTVIKIDDISLDYSNPGVWCHSLHDLMDRKAFTSWDAYTNDAPSE